jgi:hypothetical protein
METPIKKRSNNGTFAPGNTEGKGRPKGTVNKTTKELRDLLHSVIESELNNLSEKMVKLTEKERLEILVKLLPYVMPKMEQNEVTVHSEPLQLPPIIINHTKTTNSKDHEKDN